MKGNLGIVPIGYQNFQNMEIQSSTHQTNDQEKSPQDITQMVVSPHKNYKIASSNRDSVKPTNEKSRQNS